MNVQTLRQGVAYALVHAARLTDDAAVLYDAGRFSTAFAVAVLAREELGRCHLLWREADRAYGGATLDPKQLRALLRDHDKKLRAGISTFELTFPPDYVTRLEVARERKDRVALDELEKERKRLTEAIKEGSPRALHKARLASLYVDLRDDNTGWSTPSEVSSDAALNLILAVMSEVLDHLYSDEPRLWGVAELPTASQFEFAIMNRLGLHGAPP